MNTLNKYYNIISLSMLALILLLVFSMKMTMCSVSNDMRSTKKATKEINQKSLTKDDLDAQRQEYLLQEKQLDNVKSDSDIQKILKKDTIKIKK